jgi:ergothioneine biosynthesis protein EgtB
MRTTQPTTPSEWTPKDQPLAHPPPDLYREVRALTEHLTAPLEPEDFVLQSMPDASPAKWHLAHTTWFFETFLLAEFLSGYAPFDPAFSYLFNSYYNAVGQRHPRPRRGLISRPGVAEVFRYRAHVDAHMLRLLVEQPDLPDLRPRLLVGLNHEQQHQELLLTDVKHAFSCNPLLPAYRREELPPPDEAPALRWIPFPGGLRHVGHVGEGFAFDNETPRHETFVPPFDLASRTVTNGEFLAFMADGGYDRPELWLSDGWDASRAHGWRAPLYWENRDGAWWQFTLRGPRAVCKHEPVCHLSYYEADAFARWAGARLPTEAEWEVVARACPLTGNTLDTGRLHPASAGDHPHLPSQMFGDVWEWTASPYVGYPGFRPLPGALGEYNGKFMVNQMVLRGGSCATPLSHLRPTYRNFFPPHARWQFTGLRLARDV